MSADELRQAAATLRERAEAATPGPWGVGNGTDVVTDVQQRSRGSYSYTHKIASLDDIDYDEAYVEPRENGATEEDDAAWIATVHPGVGLALADWLDATAGRVEELWQTITNQGVRDEATPGIVLGYTEAVAVARLVNGGAS